jgi:hypothetical protein
MYFYDGCFKIFVHQFYHFCHLLLASFTVLFQLGAISFSLSVWWVFFNWNLSTWSLMLWDVSLFLKLLCKMASSDSAQQDLGSRYSALSGYRWRKCSLLLLGVGGIVDQSFIDSSLAGKCKSASLLLLALPLLTPQGEAWPQLYPAVK